MTRRSNEFNMFYGTQVRDFLEDHRRKIRTEIEQAPEQYLLDVDETEYVNYLTQKYAIERPVIDFEGVFVNDYEKSIPSEQFPPAFFTRPGKSYPKQVVVYYLPFTGDAELFHHTPSQFSLWFPEVFLEERYVCFEIVNFSGDMEMMRSEASRIIAIIKTFLEALTRDVETYGINRDNIEQMFQTRKQRWLNNKNMLALLGIPIKRRDNLSNSFDMPFPEKAQSIETQVTERRYKPEPTNNEGLYRAILEVIHDTGKVFERLPSTYFNKGEEDIRDLLLLQLEPQFNSRGSVTGETFNKVGKTDILIRHVNSIVFIAECKFWKGQEQYLNTITQLLSYLTWRDTQTAVIIFVKNKEISSVLEIVKQVTPQHPNFLGFVDEQDTSWFNYRFHINDDPNREVKLAVMLYHIPNVYGRRIKQS